MPSRPYSALVVGGLWPASDPESWQQSGTVLEQKAHELLSQADQIRQTADAVPAQGQSGQTVEGFVSASHRSAQTVTGHADEYFTMAGAAHEISRVLHGLRSDLDDIDRQANEEIQRILSTRGPGITAATQAAALNAVVTEARARATEKAATATAAINAQTTKLAGDFDLDTQYLRPQGLPGGGAPRGTIAESTVECGAYVTALTQITTTYLSLMSQCCNNK